jgi:inorganic phosphate transporter, PiT family
MILLFLTSGLFLGWSLGANDASNVFGSAVGSKMVTFRRAATIASVAVIFGAVLQGSGASDTLGKLGSVNAIGGAFTLALAAAFTVYVMTKFSLPVSSTQAIVGAIIGWNLFTGNKTDAGTLSKIVMTWITGPVIGALFAILLYMLIVRIKKASKIHLLRFESLIRKGLIIVGAFGAYSLGANNIANVMGVFIPSFNLDPLDLGIITLSSGQQLFLVGGLAIAMGIITYSKKVMDTIGGNIVELSPEGAMVVVLAQSLVLFIFSSSGISTFFVRLGLPPIPLVPVSSSQVIVGCIIGIGIYKGVRNINFRLLGEIAIGWLSTPVLSGLLAFFSLFFIKNIFGIDVGHKITAGGLQAGLPPSYAGSNMSDVFKYLLLVVVVAGTIAVLLYYLFERKKMREFRLAEKRFWKNMK